MMIMKKTETQMKICIFHLIYIVNIYYFRIYACLQFIENKEKKKRREYFDDNIEGKEQYLSTTNESRQYFDEGGDRERNGRNLLTTMVSLSQFNQTIIFGLQRILLAKRLQFRASHFQNSFYRIQDVHVYFESRFELKKNFYHKLCLEKLFHNICFSDAVKPSGTFVSRTLNRTRKNPITLVLIHCKRKIAKSTKKIITSLNSNQSFFLLFLRQTWRIAEEWRCSKSFLFSNPSRINSRKVYEADLVFLRLNCISIILFNDGRYITLIRANDFSCFHQKMPSRN